MPRQFIDETIERLNNSAKKIQSLWDLFKEGTFTKRQFEEQYHQTLFNCIDSLEDEKYHPNNGCRYSETNPKVDYFKTQKHMKNWADIEETLFQKISFRKAIGFKWWNFYDKDIYRWRILYKVIRKHLGQDFDKVFSLICHKFPRNDWGNQEFLKMFEGRYPTLMIDENNRVVLRESRFYSKRLFDKPKKEVYIFKSHDFVEQTFYKYKGNKRWTTEHGWYLKPIDKKTEIVRGYKKEFISKNDREFKRLKAEKRKYISKSHRKVHNPERVESQFRDILQKWKENCELNQSKQAEKLREAKRKNLEIIERLGFDPVISFRGHQRKIKTKNDKT